MMGWLLRGCNHIHNRNHTLLGKHSHQPAAEQLVSNTAHLKYAELQATIRLEECGLKSSSTYITQEADIAKTKPGVHLPVAGA